MAHIKGKFIHGKMNDSVYRELNGKQIIQSMPATEEKKRTEGTKKAATVFGKASKLAAEIRSGLHHISSRFYDGQMIARLSKEVLYSLNAAKITETQSFNFKEDSFRSLVGFEFNIKSPLKTNLLVAPTFSLTGTTLKVAIPEINVPIDLKFPEDRLEGCKLLVLTTILDLVHKRTKRTTPQIMDIPYSYEPKVLPGKTFEFEVTPGCLCITAISLQFTKSSFAGDIIVNNKLFNPAAIIHAFIPPGTSDNAVVEKWPPHSYLSDGL
ncbi:MAG TPA: hypothetical protein VL088_04815 [Pedobacter sp.]|nr:hypothetical protein [Pedobacter sp.]